MAIDQEIDGVNVCLLTVGTRLVIETSNSFYEMEILENQPIQIFGGTLNNGQIRFKKPTPMFLHGSTWGGSSIKLDWICVGMNMEMSFGGHESITTSKVKRIKITI